jgi:crotonobetainyl-CoA:carnitine CoA-transferase CaiB-like acyl-CoA transferase
LGRILRFVFRAATTGPCHHAANAAAGYANMTSPSAPPLRGVRVLDLTRLLPGPLASRHLGELGAEVVKVEAPGGGDYGRELGPTLGAHSAFFELLNRGKRSLQVDLKHPAGVALLRRLVRHADVVLEGFRPGVAERLGVGWEALRAENPRLVYCAISGYGQTGPLRGRAGHDINYLALSGVLDQIGASGSAPVLPNFQIGDCLGGAASAAMAILAALVDVRGGGAGRFLDVSMTDALLAQAVMPLAHVLAGSVPPPRGADMLSGGLACYGVYRTQDGRHMAVGALERKFWQRLCAALERPDLEALHLASGAAGARVRGELERIFAGRSQAEWIRRLADTDCCVTPVLTTAEALAADPLRANGGVPALFRFEGNPGLTASMAPEPGADSAAILREAGLPAAEIDDLLATGVVFQPPDDRA